MGRAGIETLASGAQATPPKGSATLYEVTVDVGTNYAPTMLSRHYEYTDVVCLYLLPPRQFVEKKFPKVLIGSRWRRGNGEWYLSTPQWEFVASPMSIDQLPHE